MKRILSVVAFVASASMALAAFTPIVSVTYNTSGGAPTVRTLTSLTTENGDTFNANGLANGTTSTTGTVPGSMARMDNFDINDLATGFNNNILTTNFGGADFTNFNGSLPDFFIFEGAGSSNPDDISVAAILADGTLGRSVAAPTTIASPVGWGNTGEVITDGPAQNGQTVAGLCWNLEDLQDASGNPLSSTTVIRGVAITAGFGVDPLALFAAVKPISIDHFAVTASVTSANVGDVFNVTITAQDSGNNTVNSGSAVVTASAPGSLMEFDWNSDGTYGDKSGTLVAGVKTIKARNLRAETAAIVATSGAVTTPTPPSVTTAALPFSKLQVLAPGETGAPGTVTGKAGAPTYYTVGTSFIVTVNAVDAYWNFIPTAPADTISILSSDNTATLPADATLAAGTQTFSVNFNQRGVFTITATNTSNAVITNGVSASIISALPIVWQGDGSLNNWDILTTANWTNLAGATLTYADGDVVTFDNTGSATPAVNIAATVKPSGFTVNSANNYTFGSASGGGIGGAVRLTKIGTGTLTLNTSNSYTGGTFASGGHLILSNANALPGTGTLALTNSAVVLAAANLNRSAIVSGTSVGFAAVGANRSVNLGNVGWGSGNFFSGDGDFELVLGRATDAHTVEFQSLIDFFSNAGQKIIRVENGAAAVDAVISGRIQDNSGNTGTLVKTGAGTLQLSHPTSNYEVPTMIQDGTLIVTGGSMDSDNVFVLGNGATSAVLQLGNASTNYNLTVGSLTTSGTGTGNRVVGGNASVSTLTVNAGADVAFDGVIGGPGANENNLALAKSGTGTTLTLSRVNTYSGATIINSGTLALTGAGSINNSVSIEVTAPDTFDVSAVTGGYVLGAAQTLKGLGNVTGNVTANGRIAPGSTGIGTLTFYNDLTLMASAALVMDIDRANTPNCDAVTVYGTFTPGGTLIVTNIGTTAALALNDTFQLFSTAVSGFSQAQLPPTPSGLAWTNNLAVDGSISLVAAPAPAPTNITFTVSGGNLILNWPAGQGWQLQCQTNPLTIGINTSWVPVSGAVPPFTNAVSPANGTVFYRLVYP